MIGNRRTTTDSIRILRVHAGPWRYALDMSQVVAIREAGSLAHSLNRATPVREIDYSGLPLPAVKLSRRLAPHASTMGGMGSDRGYLVVVGAHSRPWAMLVDSVDAAFQVPRNWMYDLPACCGDRWTSPFTNVLLTPSTNNDSDSLGPDFGASDRISLMLDVDRLHPDASLQSSLPGAVRTKLLTLASPISVPASRYQILNFVVSGRLDRSLPTYVGASFAQILEITSPGSLVHVPYAPSFVEGITVWRDRIVPIIDLARRLDLPPMPLYRRRWVIARATKSGELIGFSVDPSIQVLRLPTPHRPSSIAGSVDLIRGIFELKDRTLVIPDFAAVALYR